MAAGKKLVDSWKAKKWFTIISPKFLGEVEVTKIPSESEDNLLNRILVLPLKDITHDISHMYTNVKLRINEIKGKSAYTKFIGHEVSREYLGTLVRRKRDALAIVFPVASKDEVRFTIKALIVTANACSNRQKTSLRNALRQELSAKAKATEFGVFIREILYGKAGAEASSKLKKIAPIKRVEIRKTELYEEFDTPEIQKTEGEELEETEEEQNEETEEEQVPEEETEEEESEASVEEEVAAAN